MEKWLIGLILTLIGFVIIVGTLATVNPFSIGSQQTCTIGVVIGGIFLVFGAVILRARFEKWMYR